MLKPRAVCSSLLLIIVSLVTALGQTEIARNDKGDDVAVTIAATAGGVRIAAVPSAVQIRLEVYDSTGKKLVDHEVRGGNVLDWHLQDGQAERLRDDNYLCLVTVKSLSGKLTQRIGSVTIEQSSATVQPLNASQMTTQQSQAVGPIEENASLLVLNEDDERTTTVIAHNGDEGQIIRGKGALSFRTGDFFSGKDTEQMRLTAEGNLGIGLTHPQTRLDVHGVIRASQGIMFPDGTIQTTAAVAGSTGKAKPGQSQNGQDQRPGRQDRTSVGTAQRQNRVSPEFMVNEDLTVDGSIFFTTGFPRDIAMLNNTGGVRIYSAPTLTNSPASAAIQFFGTGSAFTGQAYIDSGAHDSAAVIFRTAGTGGTIAERMRITATGKVGIGTASPASSLDVAGAINASTQYNLAGNRVLATPGTNNVFAGIGTGAVNTGTDNTFVGFNAGNANTTNLNFPANENSFFGSHAGESNTTGIRNSFFGTFAGRFNTTGNDNCIFGDRAGVFNNGGANAFFGTGAGFVNSNGSINSFFGRNAGNLNTTGSDNSFFGGLAGNSNTTGSNNSFFGESAGLSNTAEDNNTFIGANSNGMAGVTNATAIGANAQVTASNSLVLGSINGVNGANADTNVGIGTTAPEQRLSVSGAMNIDQGNQNNGTTGFALSFGHASGEAVGSKRTAGGNQFGLDFYTKFANRMSITQNGDVGIGTTNPSARLHVTDGTGASTNGAHVQIGQTVADADEKLILFGSSGGCNGGPCVYIGEQDAGARMVLRASTFRVKGGNWNPDIDNSQQLGQPSNRWSEVWAANGTIQTSDARLKQRIESLRYGLAQVMKLRPVSFKWKDGSDRRTHLGLIAQEVESIMPEMIERGTDASESLGMNYNNLIPVLINAIKQQQQQISALQGQKASMEVRFAALERKMKKRAHSRRAANARRK